MAQGTDQQALPEGAVAVVPEADAGQITHPAICAGGGAPWRGVARKEPEKGKRQRSWASRRRGRAGGPDEGRIGVGRQRAPGGEDEARAPTALPGRRHLRADSRR
jgi:hypothetical protein